MSADLFAEFEPFSKPTQRQSQQSQSSDKPGAGQPLQPTSSPTPFSPNQIPFGAGAPLSQPNISQNNQWFSYQQPSSAVGWTASSNFNASHTSQPKVDEDDDDDVPANVLAHEQLSELLKGTVLRGEGNSCILTGPPGSGKTQVWYLCLLHTL